MNEKSPFNIMIYTEYSQTAENYTLFYLFLILLEPLVSVCCLCVEESSVNILFHGRKSYRFEWSNMRENKLFCVNFYINIAMYSNIVL